MATIKKKTWPELFELVRTGKKRFDVRVAEFDVKAGDTLVLEEWDPKTGQFTGRSIQKTIDYAFTLKLDDFGQKKEINERGIVVLQFKDN